MTSCPLVEAGSKENWGRPQIPDLIILGPCLTSMVIGNTILIATHPKRIVVSEGFMLRKVMPMQQLFEVNVKVRGRQTSVKILKLGNLSVDGGV